MAHSYIGYHQSKYRQAQKASDALVGGAMDHYVVPSMRALGMPLKARTNLPKVRKDTERAKLRQLGMSETMATLSIRYLSFLPRTSDADAQGIQAIIRAIQMHFGLPQTGFLDAETASYLRRVGGEDWFDMNWSSLVGHTLAAPRGRAAGLSGYLTVGDFNVPSLSTLGIGAAVLALAYLALK